MAEKSVEERLGCLETGRLDDQRAVLLVAENLKEKVDNLKTLVKVVSGILFLAIALAGLWMRGH